MQSRPQAWFGGALKPGSMSRPTLQAIFEELGPNLQASDPNLMAKLDEMAREVELALHANSLAQREEITPRDLKTFKRFMC